MDAIQDAGAKEGVIIIQSRLLPNDTIRGTVTDNGPGVDAGEWMGLSISCSIIEAHCGQLWIDMEHCNGASL